ncbi:MAG: DUF3148 domain-containing protein [Kaiparowitsia implicata GSE-PSE-MK54-09C]|jgi:hypothetical protein|nr:DUF3148 domain-containing protein [Kaiparowitsia implicata GSE-PSE-MK54-09C]
MSKDVTPDEKEFAVGDRVRVIALPAYIKTAEPMPMLRPPGVITLGEEGTVLDRRPGGYWGVRFNRGAFLIESQYIEPISHLSPEAS